jgi:hypothetical protein
MNSLTQQPAALMKKDKNLIVQQPAAQLQKFEVS